MAFTIPRIRSIAPVVARCVTVSIIGVPPPTLALARSAATRRSASSASSPPWAARSALLAVTYGLPRSSARRAQVSGPSRPPASSTTMSASRASSGVPTWMPLGRSGRFRLRTATDSRVSGSGPARTSSPRAEPTVPQPMRPMRKPLGHGAGLGSGVMPGRFPTSRIRPPSDGTSAMLMLSCSF